MVSPLIRFKDAPLDGMMMVEELAVREKPLNRLRHLPLNAWSRLENQGPGKGPL
jgi:hypothetical protein